MVGPTISKEMIDGMKKAKRLNNERIKEELKRHKLSNAEKEKTNEAKKQVEMYLQLIEETQKSLEEKDEVLEVKEANAGESLSAAQGLLKHGTDRLVEAYGESTEISIATIMIQSSQEKIKEVNEASTKLGEERKTLRKRKAELLENCQALLKKKKE